MTADLLEMFSQANVVEEWGNRMTNYIVPWVATKGKSYWDVVRFHGHWHGELKELSRADFAKLIINVCKDVLDNTDTEKSLKENMQKFPHKESLRKRTKEEKRQQCPNVVWRFELLPDSHVCRALIKELDDLYKLPLKKKESSDTPTIKERLEEYLNTIVDEQRFAKVFVNPNYCGYTATLSVEQYVKQEFMNNRNASHIIVYECTDECVDEKKVLEYAGKYCNNPLIKLYVCSMYGFNIHTQSIASSRNVGLMRIDPRYEVTDDCYVVARSVELYTKSQLDHETLRGERKMTTPFVIFDNYCITNSIAETLSGNGIAIKTDLCLTIPRLTNEYIECRALEMVKAKVDDFVCKINNYYSTKELPSFDANPEQLLFDAGYDMEEADLSSTGHIALIDLKNRNVIIDKSQINNNRRRRYSLAHELGHAILHSNLNISVFEESGQTFSMTAVASESKFRWLEHHANYFASCLLMPQDVVGYLYSFYCQKCFGRNIIRPITFGSQRCQQRDFYKIVNPMAQMMEVSIDALKWRLVKLGLLKIIQTANTPSTIMYNRF